MDQLERAVVLLDRGLLTQAEFAALKRHVLSHCVETPVCTDSPRVGDDGVGGCVFRSAKRPTLDRGCSQLVRGAMQAALGWWRHHDIFSMSIAPFLHDDLAAALRCRAVCSRWKNAVRMAGLDPLEAGLPREAVERGILDQQQLLALRRREQALWAQDEHKRNFEKLSNDLQQQHGLNGKMRQILVDWLLELHWNTFEHYMEHSYVIHLAVQLVDRYIAIKVHAEARGGGGVKGREREREGGGKGWGMRARESARERQKREKEKEKRKREREKERDCVCRYTQPRLRGADVQDGGFVSLCSKCNAQISKQWGPSPLV